VTEPQIRLLAAVATAVGLIAGGYDAHLAPQADGWWHGVTGRPSGSGLFGALIASVFVFWIGARTSVRPFFWMSAGLLPLIPATTGLASAGLFFSGFTMILLFVILSAFCLRDSIPNSTAVHPVTAAVIAFVFFVLVGRYLPGPAGPQGDEPHYLLIAESLLTDGDVDLKNQFQQRAFSKFTSADLDPHTAPRSPAGTMYAIHTPGLSALVAPGYALGGFPGARAVVSAVLAIVVGLLCFSAKSLFGPGAANFVFVLATFASPLPIYANTVFPDPVAALPLAATLAFLSAGRPAHLALASVSIAFLPWLHPRFLPVALLLALVLSLRDRFSPLRAMGAGLPLLIATAGLLAHFQAVFGEASLQAAYGPGFASDVSVLRIPWGGAALVLDRQFGLLLFSPVLILAAIGATRLWGKDRLIATTLGIAALSFFAVGGAFSMWWGGASPPARFLIGVTPALLFLCSAGWSADEKPGRARAALALGMGYGGGLLLLACMAPRALHNRTDGQSGLLRLLAPALDGDRFFPGFVTESSVVISLLWGVTCIAALARPAASLIPMAALVSIGTLGSTRPLLEAFPASLRALEAWSDHPRTFGGEDRAESFLLEIPLGGAPWALSPGQRLYSPRFSLPPGQWTMRVVSRAKPAPGVLNVARVAVVGDNDAPFASVGLRIDVNETEQEFAMDAAQRRLRVQAEGYQSETEVLTVTLRPSSGFPRR
jgi:hypothetical protein